MAGKFTKIPQNTFEGLQFDAGVLLKRFNPNNPVAPADADIICATTGGITINCKPTFSDFGENVDNVPKNMKEFKHLDEWECSIETTSLGTTPELIKLALGCADIDGETKIIPRMSLKQTDFSDLWWVGDRADGGLVACKLKNGLATEGLSLKTTKNGKGEIGLTIMGHVSIDAQDEHPMEFYSMSPSEVDFWNVSQVLSHVTSSFEENAVADNQELEVTLTADEGYVIENTIVMMGGEDITDDVLVSNVVTIPHVTGNVQIICTAIVGV